MNIVNKDDIFPVNVNSETGDLEAVIIHSMGSEVENMTPETAEHALYSDILNLSVASQEFSQLRGALQKFARVFEVKDLLADVLCTGAVKADLVEKVCKNCPDPHAFDFLMEQEPVSLAGYLIEGLVLTRDSLTRFLSPRRFAIKPLHNFFFTRDAAMSINNRVLVGKMASQVRSRESVIMDAIFSYHSSFQTKTFHISAHEKGCEKVSIEGGDVLVAREDVLLIGLSARTTSQGIDQVIERLKEMNGVRHIIAQELPADRESFIHLDMVFTILNHDECMIYEPVVMHPNRYKTIHIIMDNGKVRITEELNLLESLKKLGMDMKPIYCGGTADPWTQEREQWHSGANFFTVGPGKIIGYGRNVYTIEELSKNGYEVIRAIDIMKGDTDPHQYGKFVVTIDGSELSRGGGGARCMTMPVRRKLIGN